MLIATLALVGGTALAVEPTDLLLQMSEAARSANYQGVVVYQAQSRLETLRVVHAVHDGVEVERIKALTGAPREILKRDGKVICLLPRDRKLTLERPTPKSLLPELTAERVALLATVYQFESIGEERVAGRRCIGLSINPRDQFRYGYEIWADAETRVPLKVNLLARDGAVLEQMMFTEIDFPRHIPASAFEVEDDPRERRTVAAVAAEPEAPAAEPGPEGRFRELPPGFRVVMRSLRPAADGSGLVEHLLLTDGLSAISVFSVRREAPAQPFQGQSRMGAVHAFGRVYGTLQITVVGEAPPETVRLIGENLQPGEEAAQPVATPVR